MFLNWAFCVIFGCVGFVWSTSQPGPGSQCGDVIYDTFLMIRSDMYYNELATKLWPGLIETVDNITEVVGLDINDNHQLRQLACELSEAETLADLAEITNYPEETLEGLFTGNEHFGEYSFEQERKECRNINRWMMRSGFPDNWPLQNINIDRTKAMLDSTPLMSPRVIGFYLSWEMSNSQLAVVLNNSTITSLDEYIDMLGGNELTRQTQTGIVWAQSLSTEKGLEVYTDYTYANEAALQMLQYELLHLWRDD